MIRRKMVVFKSIALEEGRKKVAEMENEVFRYVIVIDLDVKIR